jgi:hypothetical protein
MAGLLFTFSSLQKIQYTELWRVVVETSPKEQMNIVHETARTGHGVPHIAVAHFFFFTMKFAVGTLLIATASAFTATSLQSARAFGAVKSAPVAFAPLVRLSQT